ncbi:MAG: alpha/beta fold hydrolase [Candidatus Hydrogenedentes bacterium]|nr:alpha/beta fold hydrolase [Candidatus Hydrogenedentota bacterium]
MPQKKQLLVKDHTPMSLPIWRESLMGVDYLRLKTSLVYYGIGISKGDGSAVVVVPGFLGIDAYLIEMYAWLWRIGYKPYMSRIGQNAECPNILIDHLMKTVERAFNKTGKRVHVIGHSLGGVLSRSAAVLHPDKIASVITLGSPIRGVRVHPWVLNNAERVRQKIYNRRHLFPAHKPHDHACYTSRCMCGFSCTWREGFPEDVRQAAIYTKTDGIVDWKVCINEDPKTNFEVCSTHCGLAWNPAVYTIIAKQLALPALRKRRARTNGTRRSRKPLAKTA